RRLAQPGSTPFVGRGSLDLSAALAEPGRQRLAEGLPLLYAGMPAGNLRRARAPVVRIAEVGVLERHAEDDIGHGEGLSDQIAATGAFVLRGVDRAVHPLLLPRHLLRP